MKTIMIATTNEGKYHELAAMLLGLPVKVISLAELETKIKTPEETEATIEGNAILKAKYYARMSGHVTIADDGGLFIDALEGWPGVVSARIGNTPRDRMNEVLQRMERFGMDSERGASFKGVLALYDPQRNDLFVATGKTRGSVTKHPRGDSGFGYDPIFYVPEIDKTYAEMSSSEKNMVSHRGTALAGIKRFILNTYGGKHFIVPVGIIVRDGKILLNRRNDTEKPELHGLWEFPGGGMEIGETVEENLLRELYEECGYRVEIVSQLRHVWTVQIKNPRSLHYGIQIYLLPFVCTIVAGDGKYNDEEVLESAWVDPELVGTYELIGENKKMYEKLYPELIEIITHNKL